MIMSTEISARLEDGHLSSQAFPAQHRCFRQIPITDSRTAYNNAAMQHRWCRR
jgi:hypothetical protein